MTAQIQAYFSDPNHQKLVVHFSKRTFLIEDVKMGNQNLILIGSDYALRIRKSKFEPWALWKQFTRPDALIDSLHDSLNAYKELSRHGVDVAKIDLQISNANEFLFTEKIDIQMYYYDYLQRSEKYTALSIDERRKIDKDFVHFAKSTAQFENFGDFNASQLVYSKTRGWVLLDYSKDNHIYKSGSGHNVFEQNPVDKVHLRHQQSIAQYGIVQAINHKPGLPKHMRERIRLQLQESRGEAICREQF